MVKNMENSHIPFSDNLTVRQGYRLQALEVFNWGTFHHKIWKIEPQLENALLTGDIGSGKSTLVDAITTLLVPHHKIIFNAAAGAQSKERTIRSYILGEYKNVREGFGVNAKPISLRDPRSTYSVLIARFHNESLTERVSLAQVLWIEDGKDRKFFIVAKGTLSLEAHFTDFGSDVMQLKSRLRKASNVEVFDSFKEYNQRFRQYFGMSTGKTLQLFYQTVSMKSVDNLTLFVRNHMLEESDAREQLAHLLQNFENLQRAHEAVMKARKQMEMLDPIVKEGRNYEKITKKVQAYEGARMALPMYVAEKKTEALQMALKQARNELQDSESSMIKTEADIRYIREQIDEIRDAYLQSGGDRINTLKNNIENLKQERQRRQVQWERYTENLSTLQLDAPADLSDFEENRRNAKASSEAFAKDKQKLSDELLELQIKKANQTKELDAEQQELDSLRQRKNQIPRHLIALRVEMTEALGLTEVQVPFAGELLQVKKEEGEWEGAIERVLRGLALGLLVPGEHYHAVSQYIDRTDLKGRLVYHRTFKKSKTYHADSVPDHSLIHKIEIKPGTPFEDWLETQLEERYNYLCVDNLEEFRRAPYALTRSGQVKQGRSRHEKDDRRRIGDKRHFVLGWTNEKKIMALESALKKLQAGLNTLTAVLESNQQHQAKLEEQVQQARELLHFQAFEEIDWKERVARIEDAKEEIVQLERSSDQLATLKASIANAEDRLKAKNLKRDELISKKGKLEERIDIQEKEIRSMESIMANITPGEKELHFPTLEKLDKSVFTLESADPFQSQLSLAIKKKIDLRNAELSASQKKLIGYMTHFTRSFPEDTIELQATAEYLPEMRDFHKKLKDDDLPKYEKKFKELLQKGTINDIALFKNKLEDRAHDILEKIELINQSLREIEYNPGTYIHLVPHEETDFEIREFRDDLKNCLSHSLGQDSYYSEEKYLQVKKLLDRFQHEGDKRWREKVTDVRNWYAFGASEKNLETQEEVNYYSDSSGKSGGQKEKLAYTVLASALAYQYGIHDERKSHRAFRFVVIDEAFGRGSDESTRFGLELFKKMDLQLLVVTPMQKINVIQPYIAYVHFVSNPNGQNSEVLTLTKEEFLKLQEEYWIMSGDATEL